MDRKPRAEGGPYIGRPMPRFEDLRLVRGAGQYSDDISMPGQAYRGVRALAARACRRSSGSTPAPREDDAGRDRGADRRRLCRRRVEGRDAARQSGRRDRHQGPRLRAGEAAGAGGAAISAGRRPRALSGRSGGDGGGGERCRRARCRRGGRGRIRGAAGGDRRAQGDRRRADLAVRRRTTSRSIRSSATPRRCGRRSTRPISWSSRPSSTSASPTARWSRARASRSYDAAADSYTLISGNQGVHAPRMVLAESFGLPLEKIRFVCPDVGGGFGLRNNLYPEQAAILWAAQARRPSGEMDQRPLGILPHRLCRPRSGHHRAARARPATAASPPITSITSAPAAGRP